MKKKLLLFVIACLPILVMGQKNVKVLEFMSHMKVSTSNDAEAQLKLDSLWAADINLDGNLSTKTKASKLKSTSQKKSLIDTAYTFPWIPASQQWDTVPIGKIIYTYDSQYNLTNYLSLTRVSGSSSWQNSIQIIYNYDVLNHLVSSLQQNWKNKGRGIFAWVNNNQKFWTYDSLNRESNFLTQTWNVNKNKWVNSWQHDFTYDSMGNNTQILETTWNVSINSWSLSCHYINSFDSLNRVILSPIQMWSDTSWINAAQTSFKYDAGGNKTSMLNQSWDLDSLVWRNSELDSSFYLSSNRIDKSLIKLWDGTKLEWYNQRQCIYDYDSLGNNTSILIQDYDTTNYHWFNNSKNVYEYDSLKTQISNATLNWDLGAENWSSGTLTKLTITYYDALKSGLIKQSDQTVSEKQTAYSTPEVFPNPASDFVMIQNNVPIDEVQIFDLLGNKLIKNNYNDLTTISLDIRTLKPGIYLMNVKDNTGISVTKRLIKN